MGIQQYTFLANPQTSPVGSKGVQKRGRQPITPPPKEKLAALYPKHALKAIGEMYGVSYLTARKWFRDYGIPLRPGQKIMTPPPREELAALYLKFSTREMAQVYGVHVQTVRKWFCNYGIPMDRRGGRKQQTVLPPKEKLASLYPEHSLQQIAKMYGVVHGTVRNWLAAYGIPMARMGGRVGVSTLKRPDVRTDSIVALTKAGLTVEQIAEKLNISRGLVFYRQKLAKLAAAEKKASKYDEVGRTAEDEIWAYVDELKKQELKWKVIKSRADTKFGYRRSIGSYDQGLRRYRARPKEPTK
jgi:transposase